MLNSFEVKRHLQTKVLSSSWFLKKTFRNISLRLSRPGRARWPDWPDTLDCGPRVVARYPVAEWPHSPVFMSDGNLGFYMIYSSPALFGRNCPITARSRP